MLMNSQSAKELKEFHMNLGNIIRNAMGRTAGGTRTGGAPRRPSVPNVTGRPGTAGRSGGIANRVLGMLKRR